MTANEFIQEYKKYVNHYGKISPYIYVITKYANELKILIDLSENYNIKKKKLTEIINDAFYVLPKKAKSLKISSKQFNYVGPKNLKKIELNVLNNESISSAISALYAASLYGDKLQVIN